MKLFGTGNCVVDKLLGIKQIPMEIMPLKIELIDSLNYHYIILLKCEDANCFYFELEKMYMNSCNSIDIIHNKSYKVKYPSSDDSKSYKQFNFLLYGALCNLLFKINFYLSDSNINIKEISDYINSMLDFYHFKSGFVNLVDVYENLCNFLCDKQLIKNSCCFDVKNCLDLFEHIFIDKYEGILLNISRNRISYEIYDDAYKDKLIVFKLKDNYYKDLILNQNSLYSKKSLCEAYLSIFLFYNDFYMDDDNIANIICNDEAYVGSYSSTEFNKGICSDNMEDLVDDLVEYL